MALILGSSLDVLGSLLAKRINISSGMCFKPPLQLEVVVQNNFPVFFLGEPVQNLQAQPIPKACVVPGK
jgi:hypothetical protein